MFGRRYKYPVFLCVFALFRTGHLYRFNHPRIGGAIMSKSIRSFFVSKTVAVEEGSEPRKKAKIEALLVEETTTIESASAPETPKEEVQVPALAAAISAPVTADSPQIGWPPFDCMEPGWKAALASEYNRPYFKSLLEFLNKESKTQTVYPPAKDLFSAFNLCPLDQVKVVVIGQDPYHGPDQAHGLAFSVRKGVAIPPSLKNMIIEARDDPKVSIAMPAHGNLEAWSRQGVLMLNTVLTVRKGDANSHQKKGWEDFTDAVVRVLAKKQHLVYLLWGNPAQQKCKGIDGKHNTMITTSHPSPLGAYKTSSPFMGSRCFSRCNEALEGYNKDPIDWSIV